MVAADVVATKAVLTFCVNAASVARVTVNPVSFVEASTQLTVVVVDATTLKVSVVGAVTVDGGVNLYTRLEPSAVECKLAILVELVYEFKLNVAALLTVLVAVVIEAVVFKVDPTEKPA